MVRIRIGKEELHLAWDDWERRVREGRVPPDAAVQIEAVTGAEFVRADSLETYHSLRDDAALAWQSQFASGPAPLLTALLVGFQVRVWWFAQVPEIKDWMLPRFTNWTSPALEDGQTWRLITMGLFHTGLFHLVLNMLWLAYVGWNLEQALGRANLAILYFASVVGGSLLSMFMSPETPSLGASGGVFGLVAASVTFGFVRPEILSERGRRVFGFAMLPYLALMFWSGLTNERTDNWSHFGGLLVGGALALVLDPVLLERRAGWNRSWQLGIAGVIASTVAVLGLFGPRIVPLIDHDVALRRLAPRAARTPPVLGGDAPYETVSWAVPAGWRSGALTTGAIGFVSPSPAGHRAFAVAETRHDAPPDLTSLVGVLQERVAVSWSDAVLAPPEPAEVAGRPGHLVRITSEAAGTAIEWRVAVRGVYTLEEVYEVDARRRTWLTPMRDRLRARVVWRDPQALLAAREVVDRNPASLRGRGELAAALAEIGEPDAALAAYRSLLADDHDDPAVWTGMLRLAQWYPDAIPDAAPVWDEALATNPAPSMVLEVVASADARGERDVAVGLLEIAWARTPGDRTLRRARARRGLPTELDADLFPAHLAVDPTTLQPVAPEARRALADAALTVAEARRVAGARRAVRAEWATRAAAAIRLGDPDAATRALLVLRHGGAPPPPDAVEGLAVDLDTAGSGGDVPWIDDDALAAVLRETRFRPVLPQPGSDGSVP